MAVASILGFAACMLDTAGTLEEEPGTGAATSASSSSSSGGGAGGQGGSGGQQTPCTPGETTACYGGPDETRGVGACADGEAVCNDAGTGFGPCIGDVTPRTEDCSTNDDESCDGAAPCIGQVTTLFDLEGNQDIEGFGLTTVGDDAVVACGVKGVWVGEPCDDFDVGVGRIAADEAVLFSGRFGGGDRQLATGVTRDALNRLWMTGTFDPVLDFGEGELQSGNQNFWVARFDASGVHQWSRGFGSSDQDDEARAIAAGVEAADGVVVVGAFRGSVDLGDGHTLVDTGQGDVLVMRLDDDGTVGMAKRFGNDQEQHATAVARFGGGDMAVAGYYRGTLDFGAGPLPASGDYAFFVARLDREGEHVWAHGYGVGGDDFAEGVAATPDGGTVVVGHLAGAAAIDLGDPCGELAGAEYGRDAFAIKFDAAGACVWARRWGDAGDAEAHGVAVDGAGQLVITGWFGGTMTVGGEQHVSEGASDVFVLKLSADGERIWSRDFGGDMHQQRAHRVATLPGGDIWVFGEYRGTIDADGLGIQSQNDDRAFLMRVSP